MKDESGKKIMKEFEALRPKMYSCLTENCHIGKGQKPQQRV